MADHPALDPRWRRAAGAGRLAMIAALVGGAVACNDDGGSAETLCAAAADSGTSVDFQDFDPTDPEAALEQLRPARVKLGELIDAAPDEVRDDLQVEVVYLQALIDALEAVTPGDATAAALAVRAVTDAHPDVDEAAAALTAFAEREC